ncbi:hypothetical protein XENORESO_006360 [Xenotaenia resolanae]|uniref:Uncharacterized protein n=1 Tax=Xenotaenia resolanae TaxID=208358 RepID=A0ABV0W2F1_9TELE
MALSSTVPSFVTSTYLPKTHEGEQPEVQKGKQKIASPYFNTVTNPATNHHSLLRREAGAVVPMVTNRPHCSQTSPHSLLTKKHTHSHSHTHTQSVCNTDH